MLSLAEDNFIGKQDSAYYQEVIEAAKNIGVHDFIESLPNDFSASRPTTPL